jgi:hypothetical protein
VPIRPPLVAAALAVAALAACGESERERVEDAVREREDLAAGRIESVRCERAELMWGCSLRLRDGRTQACQVSVSEDGEPTGVGCQPIQAE